VAGTLALRTASSSSYGSAYRHFIGQQPWRMVAIQCRY
jgi:hypothetical protein